jgi:NAD(P)-dependent dehydrogenase (short-subunit alcohol dehydrogenase family)
MRLEPGQVAVVTGAASGIGHALATAFAQRGLSIVALDVEPGPLAAVADELRAAGTPVHASQCDVTDADRFLQLRTEVLEQFGRVDVLCNNAGVVGPWLRTWEQRRQDWRWVIDVNLWGVINGLSAFLPAIVAAGRGHVVNVASIAGLAPVRRGRNAPYAASKYAVVGLSETLAVELMEHAPGVGVTVVCPGPVATRIREAERNRPAALRGEDLPADDAAPFLSPSERIGASDVAAQVLDAIEANRLFLLPSPGTADGVRARNARLAADLPAD